MIRNLLYNCCAFGWHDEWRLNVEKLNQYASIFNGRRFIIVRVGENILPPEEVKKAFTFNAEFIELPNDPVLGECSGFLDVLGLLESHREDEITFYAHTKGVRYYRGIQWLSQMNDHQLDGIRLWRNTMYEQCLQDPILIDEIMQRFACCGCFRRVQTVGDWGFSGTFYWLNHAKLFSRPWREALPKERVGLERYPHALFNISESHCLYENPDPTQNLYTHPAQFACRCGYSFETTAGLGHVSVLRCPNCKNMTAEWQ